MLLTPRRNRSEAPRAPVEIADEVELYAREYGRTGKIHFAVGPNTWVVTLSLRPNDERMRLWQEGRAAEPPVETIWLQEPNPDEGKVLGVHPETGRPMRGAPFRALDIHQMGAAGVRAFLERGNTWSGRGEFRSVEEAVRRTYQQDAEATERFRETTKEENRFERREDRRRYLQIPAVSVGIDLNPSKD